MHSFLKAIGFSQISKREEMKKIILDVIKNYDTKMLFRITQMAHLLNFREIMETIVESLFVVSMMRKTGFMWSIDDPFFHGTGVTTQEAVTVEKHVDRNAFSGACDDLRIGITLIFYLQNTAEYMKESERKIDNYPLILSGLAGEGKILLPVLKIKKLSRWSRNLQRTEAP